MQDLLIVALAGLVFWASARLSGLSAVPGAAAVAMGAVLSVSLLLLYLRTSRAGRDSGPERGTPPEPARGAAGAVLLAIGVATLAARVHTLLDRPAWADEMWTLRNIYTSHWGELLRVAFDDYWPPLHYLILNALARIGDTSLVWLRLPSVVFGTATVVLMYPLGRDLLRSRRAGLAAAALLAGMTSHVLYSQEARVYTLVVLLAVTSAYTFYHSYWERRVSAAFLVSTILLTYSHSFASWYFIAAESVYVLVAWLIWRDGKAFMKGLQGQVIVLVAWMPLVAAFLYSRVYHEIVVPTFWATGLKSSLGVRAVVEEYQSLAVRSWAGAAFLALLLALALVPLVKKRAAAPPEEVEGPGPKTGGLVFLLSWASVPILFSLVVSLTTSLNTFGATRYHLTVLPALCLLAAAGFRQIRSKAGLTAAWLLLILLPASELSRYYREFNHPAIDEAAAIVKSEGSPQDVVYLSGGFRAFAYYYRGIFPRIGSPQWDSLAATYAGLTDRYTSVIHKWGDTYAYEKISPRIRQLQDPEFRRHYDGFVRDELARGGFGGSYWLVLDLPADQSLLDAMGRFDVVCDDPVVYHVRGLELRHCNADASAPSSE